MARHPVGDYSVEVLHRRDKKTGRIAVSVYVFRGRHYVQRADFWFTGFNTYDLRKRMKSLSAFPVRAFDAVIEDARAWPKDGKKAKPKAGNRMQRNRRQVR